MLLNNFKKRTLTAVFITAITLFCTLFSKYTFFGLWAAIGLICYWEYTTIHRYLKPKRVTPIRVVLCAVFAILFVWLNPIIFPFSLASDTKEYLNNHTALLLIIPITVIIINFFTKAFYAFKRASMDMLGLVLIAAPLIMLCFLAVWPGYFSWRLPLSIILLVWSQDVFAYLIGSKFGKTPLARKISPKKTLEGSIGGLICTMIIGVILSFLFIDLTLVEWVILAAIVAITSIAGDLLESKFKRIYGVKDSSNILPGHGGFLDRFDALLFCIPFAFVFLVIIK